MKIIDVHNHPDWHGHNLEKYLENMDANGISQTWLLSWHCGAGEYLPHYNKGIYAPPLNGPIPFERCIAYHDREPDRFILGCAPDPRDPQACRRRRSSRSSRRHPPRFWPLPHRQD